MTQRDEREKLAIDKDDMRRKERIAMAKEICLHRGEAPWAVDRGGNESWERYEPLAGAVIREAERLLALRTPALAAREAHAEIQRLQDAKRRALALADERAKENVALILAAQAVVHDYPIAAGTAKWDTEGGYGSIRDLRLALDALAPAATDTPDEGPDPLGYAKGERCE